MKVRQIGPSDTYLIRQQVLRPGKDVSTCYFGGDDSEQTLHLGAFVNFSRSFSRISVLRSNLLFSAHIGYNATLPSW